ncbi:MAG: hypothetical protein U1E29_02690 [Coriobacteriia bacterium]|nr:hypothetical protein [Coriobacteriia bacterium]
MPDSELRQQRTLSRNRNVDVLHSSGFRRIGPSSLFSNRDDCVILSPGIGEGEHGAHLFDIRVANLEKMSDPLRGALLLRLAPDWFAFVKLDQLTPVLTESTRTYGPRSGELYRFRCELDESGGAVTIVSTKDSSASLSVKLLDRDGAVRVLTAMCR